MATKWWREPQPDDAARVGIGLVDLLFALVLAQAFVETTTGYQHIRIAGWSHLVLAFITITLSWIGYHAGKSAEHLWALKFFNRPLFQYLVDLLILIAYWGLIVTAEGIPIAPDMPHTYLLAPSARPEAVLIVVIFALYAIYDTLEVGINEDEQYIRVMIGDSTLAMTDHGHPKAAPNLTRCVRVRWPWGSTWRPSRHNGTFYAFPARLMRMVTYLALVLVIMLGLGVWVWDPKASSSIVALDGVYAVILIGYRVAQSESRALFTSTSPGLVIRNGAICAADGSAL